MPAGTIALTNNSTAVTGTGTSFTAELKANDFIVTVVGGVTYTLGVQSVNSATSVTLTTAYNGPTTSGLAWTAVPNAALVGITAQVAADVARAIRGLNLDKANWQQIFSGTGNVTVTLPDGSQYTGPAWNSLSSSIANKYDKSGGSLSGPISFSSRAVAGQTAVNLGISGSGRAAVAPISQTQSVRVICDVASPVPSQGTATVTFATAFASPPTSVVVCNGNGQVASTLFISITFIGAGGFQAFITNKDGTPVTSQIQLNYTAIGVVNT
ncbi:hypothetical protein [Pantoea agglomerans]|uniref:hypothetical protein n=1 Tax=Enterobacter agglomerans TaxID=549 RepID=UPI003C7C8E28